MTWVHPAIGSLGVDGLRGEEDQEGESGDQPGVQLQPRAEQACRLIVVRREIVERRSHDYDYQHRNQEHRPDFLAGKRQCFLLNYLRVCMEEKIQINQPESTSAGRNHDQESRIIAVHRIASDRV